MADMKELAKNFAERIMQDVSYEIGDVINGYPAELQPYVMAVIKMVLESYVNSFSKADRLLYDNLISRIVMTIAPASMDPRKKEESDG